jgi:hypothetical protein
MRSLRVSVCLLSRGLRPRPLRGPRQCWGHARMVPLSSVGMAEVLQFGVCDEQLTRTQTLKKHHDVMQMLHK